MNSNFLNEERNRKITGILATLIVISIIFLIGPASAIKINLNGFSVSDVLKGNKINTTASVEINSNERIAFDNGKIYANDAEVCEFNPITTQIISGCDGIEINLISSSYSHGYGYGYKYGYDYSYGYGYGYGYNNGYSNGVLEYEIQFDTSYFNTGENKIQLKIDVGERVYSSEERIINIIQKGDITNTGGSTETGACLTSWQCSEWSDCENGTQVRTCLKENKACITTLEKPEETRECTLPENNQSGITGFFSRITGAVTGALGTGGTAVVIILSLGVVGSLVTLRIRRLKLRKMKKTAKTKAN